MATQTRPTPLAGESLKDAGYYNWMTPQQAMQYLGVESLSALYRLIREHRLPFGRVGRRYRFRRDHLDQWAVRRGVDDLVAVRRHA